MRKLSGDVSVVVLDVMTMREVLKVLVQAKIAA